MSARSSTSARLAVATALVTMLGSGAPALAADGWLLRGAFEGGGDKIGQANFDNGSSEAIKAGGEVHIEGGYRSGFVGPSWQTDLTLGYKVDSANATNGDISFARITLNAMQYFLVTEQIRVGGGATYHLNPELDFDVPTGFGGRIEGTDEADDAFGFMLAADYIVNAHVEIGVRATLIDYEFENSGQDIDGDSFGAYLTYRFGAD